nr:4Fe-4S dicluster domain-containing protein [Chthonobacter albigriseus]
MEDLPSPSRRFFITGRIGRITAEEAARTDGPRIASIGQGCLPQRGVDCQLCRDACPADAIRFRPRRGGPFLPEVSAAACTGCGACLAMCPTGSIALDLAPEQENA